MSFHEKIEKLAYEKLKEWDLNDVVFRWSKSKTCFGRAVIDKKNNEKFLDLSLPICSINGDKEILDTILHEIAHFKAGFHNGHNKVWKKWCVIVGAKPERLAKVNAPPLKYKIVCSDCFKINGQRNRRRLDLMRYKCRFCKQSGTLCWGE